MVKAVENHINLDLTVEKRARKDLEAKMLKYAEDLVGSLRADLEVEKRLRNEAQVGRAARLSLVRSGVGLCEP